MLCAKCEVNGKEAERSKGKEYYVQQCSAYIEIKVSLVIAIVVDDVRRPKNELFVWCVCVCVECDLCFPFSNNIHSSYSFIHLQNSKYSISEQTL